MRFRVCPAVQGAGRHALEFRLSAQGGRPSAGNGARTLSDRGSCAGRHQRPRNAVRAAGCVGDRMPCNQEKRWGSARRPMGAQIHSVTIDSPSRQPLHGSGRRSWTATPCGPTTTRSWNGCATAAFHRRGRSLGGGRPGAAEGGADAAVCACARARDGQEPGLSGPDAIGDDGVRGRAGGRPSPRLPVTSPVGPARRAGQGAPGGVDRTRPALAHSARRRQTVPTQPQPSSRAGRRRQGGSTGPCRRSPVTAAHQAGRSGFGLAVVAHPANRWRAPAAESCGL
jgi:hypothetical protein